MENLAGVPIKNNVREAICSLEVSKLLKERGFDVRLQTFYSGEHLQHNSDKEQIKGWANRNLPLGEWSAPTHALAIEWLRQNFGFFISTEFNNHSLMYHYVIHTNVSRQYANRINSLPESFLEPFSATEAALKLVLGKEKLLNA